MVCRYRNLNTTYMQQLINPTATHEHHSVFEYLIRNRVMDVSTIISMIEENLSVERLKLGIIKNDNESRETRKRICDAEVLLSFLYFQRFNSAGLLSGSDH